MTKDSTPERLRQHFKDNIAGMEFQCRLFWQTARSSVQADYPRFKLSPMQYDKAIVKSQSEMLAPLIRQASLETFAMVQKIMGQTRKVPLPVSEEDLSPEASDRCLQEISYAVCYMGGKASIGDVKVYLFEYARQLEYVERGDFNETIAMLEREQAIRAGLFVGKPKPKHPFVVIPGTSRVALDSRLLKSEYLLRGSLLRALKSL